MAQVSAPGVVPCEEGVLAVRDDEANGAFDGVVVDLDAAKGQKKQPRTSRYLVM